MLDQTFSAKTFFTITALENRKGFNCGAFFADVTAKHNEVRSHVSKIKDFTRKTCSPYSSVDQATYDQLLREKSDLIKARDELLLPNLRNVAKDVAKSDFSIDFTKHSGPSGKPVFSLADKPCAYYSVKHISRCLSRIYRIKQANKNNICSQLLNILQDQFPYYIVRLDIEKFYESIDQTVLMEKLRQDGLLTTKSLSLIQKALDKYSALAGTCDVGIPRGVGFSANLSELYLKSFDEVVRQTDNVVFYARYVDDIIIAISPPKGSVLDDYDKWLEKLLADIHLTKNASKSKSFSKSGASWDLEYLGYKFSRHGKLVKVRISRAKQDRYAARLKSSFIAYETERWNDSKAAYRMLLSRVRFLSANTKLRNTKKKAYTGIFYTNPLINDLSQLRTLDHKKNALANQLSVSPSLKAKLLELSFERGFQERTYQHFRTKVKYDELVSAWKHDT